MAKASGTAEGGSGLKQYDRFGIAICLLLTVFSVSLFAENRKLLKDTETAEKENEQLTSENEMLKITIGRNEAYIKRLTNISYWRSWSNETRK